MKFPVKENFHFIALTFSCVEIAQQKVILLTFLIASLRIDFAVSQLETPKLAVQQSSLDSCTDLCKLVS